MMRIHVKGNPLVDDQNNQVAEDTKQKQNLQEEQTKSWKSGIKHHRLLKINYKLPANHNPW